MNLYVYDLFVPGVFTNHNQQTVSSLAVPKPMAPPPTPAPPQPASSELSTLESLKRNAGEAVEDILSIIKYLIDPGPQVFVNFRGNELRNGFVSHVVKALKDRRMNVFIDSLEDRGVDTFNRLLERIDNSKLALAIFSNRYTESDWCLNELVRMYDRMKEGELVVIPIFYRVSTEDVKNFQGKFGRNFREMVMSRFGTYEAPMAQRWMIAVTSVASITGLTSQVHSIDSELVEEIVWASMKELGHISPRNLSIGSQILVEFCAALVVCYFFTDSNRKNRKKPLPSIDWFPALMLHFITRKTFGWFMR